MAYAVDFEAVVNQLDSLPRATRAELEWKLREVAKFAERTPPPSRAFLVDEGIDPTAVFRFDVRGVRVHYEVDPEGRTLKVVQVHPRSVIAL